MPRKKPKSAPSLDAARKAIASGDLETADKLLRQEGEAALKYAKQLMQPGSLVEKLGRQMGIDKDLAELEALLHQPAPAEDAPLEIPLEVHLERCKDLFIDREIVDEWSKEIVAAGFKKWGDYRVLEVPVVMRVFHMPPGVVAVINEFGGMLHWQEIAIGYEDGTIETWTNVPEHDGLSPPWSRLVRDPDAEFNILLDLMLTQASHKPQLSIKKAEFPARFCADYDRSMRWRAEQKQL